MKIINVDKLQSWLIENAEYGTIDKIVLYDLLKHIADNSINCEKDDLTNLIENLNTHCKLKVGGHITDITLDEHAYNQVVKETKEKNNCFHLYGKQLYIGDITIYKQKV